MISKIKIKPSRNKLKRAEYNITIAKTNREKQNKILEAEAWDNWRDSLVKNNLKD